MGEKILIVDDDVSICEILEFNLKSEGYTVQSVYSAEEALEILDDTFSLILLDVMMGGMSGFKLAEKLRTENKRQSIIFLTAKDNENDMLTGFSVGADDYISKPFSIKEIIARVKAVLQRSGKKEDLSIIQIEGVKIDFKKKKVTVDDETVKLTKTEYSILQLLINNPQRPFSRREIIDKVWGESVYVTERTVDVHIARLRKKLKNYAFLIPNLPGFGYKFESDSL